MIPIFIGWVVRMAGYMVLKFGSWILDLSINFSLNFLSDPTKTAGIAVGWTVMRDFANLFFIFIILYIAIVTILQLGDHNTKKMLVHVILVALLINFSAFFTKVVIDVGNVVTVGFYNRILESPSPRGKNPECTTFVGNPRPCTISDRFNDAMQVNALNKGADQKTPGAFQTMFIYIMTGAMFFVAGGLFIKGAYYFIARTVAFAFLIMFSPIALLSYAIPSGRGSKLASKWWEKLLNYTLLAPFYMIIIYLVLQVIGSGLLTANNTGMLDFILVIGLLYAGTNYAFTLADEAGQGVANWASKFTTGTVVGAMTGAGAYAMRQTAGRWASKKGDDERLKERIAQGGLRGKLALMQKNVYDKAAKGSWDVAQSKVGGMGMGKIGGEAPSFVTRGEGGFKAGGGIEHTLFNRGKITEAQEKEYIEKAKALYPKDPAKQQEFLRNWMGHQGDKKDDKGNYVLDADGNRVKDHNFDSSKASKETKEYRGELNRKVLEKETEDSLKKDIEEYDKQNEMLKEKQAQLQRARQDGNAILESTMTSDIKTIEGTMDRLGDAIKTKSKRVRASAVAGFDEKILKSEAFAHNVDRSVLAEVHKQYLDGKYQDQDILTTISDNVYASGNEKAKDYLASAEGKEKLFSYAVPAGYNYIPKKLAAKERLYDLQEKRLSALQDDLSKLDSSVTGYADAKKELDQKVRETQDKMDEIYAGIQEMEDSTGAKSRISHIP